MTTILKDAKTNEIIVEGKTKLQIDVDVTDMIIAENEASRSFYEAILSKAQMEVQ